MIESKAEGLATLETNLQTGLEKKIIQAMQKSVALVESEAKKKAPKGETGQLRNSIESEVYIEDGAVVGIVFSNKEYAPYVEFGTGIFAEGGNGRADVPWHYQDAAGDWYTTYGMQPQPYMRPALSESKSKITEIFKEELKQ